MRAPPAEARRTYLNQAPRIAANIAEPLDLGRVIENSCIFNFRLSFFSRPQTSMSEAYLETRCMRERRANFRVEWNSSAKIYDHDGRLIEQCVVRNFSNSGARIIGVESRTVPDEFILRISPHGRIHHCRVIWRSKDGTGVKFTHASERKLEPENKALTTSK